MLPETSELECVKYLREKCPGFRGTLAEPPRVVGSGAGGPCNRPRHVRTVRCETGRRCSSTIQMASAWNCGSGGRHASISWRALWPRSFDDGGNDAVKTHECPRRLAS